MWMLIAILLGLNLYAGLCQPPLNLWEDHKRQHSLKFSPEEEQHRYETFSDNLNFITAFNEENNKVKLQMNKFSHLKTEEILAKKTNNPLSQAQSQSQSQNLDNYTIDYHHHIEPIDYSKEVPFLMRDEGFCNGGWFMAVVSAIEYQLKLNNISDVWLSPQFLIDCGYIPKGCSQGIPEYALQFAIHNGLLEEQVYPYKATNKECDVEAYKNNGVQKIEGYEFLKNDIKLIKHYLYKHGPFVVGTTATYRTFLHYKHGIYNDDSCVDYAGDVSHFMVLVGYGRIEKTNEEYFILQNSWGKEWGEDGFMRISAENNCGLTLRPLFPIV